MLRTLHLLIYAVVLFMLGGQCILPGVIAQQESALQIVSQSAFISEIGDIHVVGEVRNNSPSVAEFVKVVGTFYDVSNRVVGTSFTFTQPSDLAPGDTAPFELVLSSASIPIQEEVNYALKTTWQTGETRGVSDDNIECGTLIRGIATLNKDLYCVTDGLIIDGDNVVVNLNGHSIRGPRTDTQMVGIKVPSTDNVTIYGPGSISNFQAGVLLTGATGFTINSITLSNNQIGTFMTGAENAQVQQNIIQGNSIGVASHSSTGSVIGSLSFSRRNEHN